MIFIEIFYVLVFLSWIYWLSAYAFTRSFFEHYPKLDRKYTPPVSILKPVKWVDFQAYENFESFCCQDYPTYEILFGVADPDDPVIPLIERLAANNPEVPIRLVMCSTQAPNRKAGMLHILASKARYSILVVSDSDMRVGPDYLRRVVAPLADPQVGLVTCPYRGEAPRTLTARLEALHMGVTFLPATLVARQLINMRFAMGATNVLRQADLQRIGGFAGFADYLADDFQLGWRIANLGLKVHLSNYIVRSMLGSTTFSDQWHREVRWAHCNRFSRPLGYLGYLITFSTPLALILVGLTNFSLPSIGALIVSISLRYVLSWSLTYTTHDFESRRWLPWLPVRDCLSALIWGNGLFGSQVRWRGEDYRLEAEGRLLPLNRGETNQAAAPSRDLLTRLVRTIDTILRDFYHIVNYCYDDDCFFRISEEAAEKEVVLRDGTHIIPGDKLIMIHFWNERLPLIPAEGAGLAWGKKFNRKLRYSLTVLNTFIEESPQFQDVKAIFGEGSFGARGGSGDLNEAMERRGFDVFPIEPPRNAWERFVSFWDSVYGFGLMWAYNRSTIQGKHFGRLRQNQIWMSRRILNERYSTPRTPSRRPEVEGEQSPAPEEVLLPRNQMYP